MAFPGSFDRAASFYDDTRGFPPGDETAIAALMARAAHLQPDDNLIEIGIGTGRLTLPLLPFVRTIYGVDSSLPMLWRLRDKHSDKPIYAAQGDVRAMPYPSGSFDAALTAHLFNILPDWQRAADEVARVLRPDGIFLNCWHRSFHKESWWKAWTSTLPGDGGDGGLPHADHHDALAARGWRPIGDEYVHIMPRKLSPRRFLEQLAGRVWTSTWALSETQLAGAIAVVREALQREHPDLDTQVEFDTLYTIRAYHPPLSTEP